MPTQAGPVLDETFAIREPQRIGELQGGRVVPGPAAGLAAEQWPFLFVATAGAVLIVVGLVILVIGLLKSSEGE